MISWTSFANVVKKRKNVLLVSFHDAKGKKLVQSLANESCKKILEVLSEGEQSASDMAKKLEMSLSKLDYNLKLLLEAKLIQVNHFKYSEKGKEMDLYSLTNKYVVIGLPEKK